MKPALNRICFRLNGATRRPAIQGMNFDGGGKKSPGLSAAERSSSVRVLGTVRLPHGYARAFLRHYSLRLASLQSRAPA